MSTEPISALAFLQIVYDHFKSTGTWPDVWTVQLRVGVGQNVRRLAAEIGADKVMCEEQQEGICFLKLEGIALCSGSERDIAHFLGVIRLAAHQYVESGRQKLTSADIRDKLNADEAEMKRLAEIMWRERTIWGGGGRSPTDPSESHIVPSENAFFFQRVSSIEDLKATFCRVDKDSQETAALRFGVPADNFSKVPVLNEALSKARFSTGDKELDDLLETARSKFVNIDLRVRREALEALWDAFERVKTVEPGKDKKESATLLLDKASSEIDLRRILGEEMIVLTSVGNNFMIRHKEMSKTPINQHEHVDYLFHRMFALIRLVLRQSGRGG